MSRHVAQAAGFYILVTLAFFGQAGGRLITHVIGVRDGDALEVLWNVWWLKRSLLRGRSPYFCEWLFAPDGTSTIWRTLDPLQSLTIALLNVPFPVEIAYNAIVLLAYPLAGVGAYVLCRDITSRHAASLVGGLAFMLSPYMVSKMNGHMNLLYAGLLPLFCTFALRATAAAAPRHARYALAGVVAAIVLTDITVLVLAANIALAIVVWRLWTRESLHEAIRRLWRAFLPAALIVLPFVVLMIVHSLRYEFAPPIRRGMQFVPEPLSYVLPFTPTSVYSSLLEGIGRPELRQYDLACYLGWLVLPLALTGLWTTRWHAGVRWCAAVLFFFLVLSLGPRLQHNRELMTIGGMTIGLPYAAWSYLPVLGGVGQTGRYLVISYIMIAVGVACAVAWVQGRMPRRRRLAVWLCAGAVLLDFAFRPVTALLPEPVQLSSHSGRVLDLRLGSPLPSYYQVFHQRPVVGGYAAGRERVPPAFRARMMQEPAIGCFAVEPPPLSCTPDTIIPGLRALNVTDIIDTPGSPRERLYEELGFWPVDATPASAVWSTTAATQR